MSTGKARPIRSMCVDEHPMTRWRSRGVSSRKQRAAALSAKAVGLFVALYFIAFLLRFDVLSCPVRDDAHGWLGPLLRGDVVAEDIGKVYHRPDSDIDEYRLYAPWCWVWLFFNGLMKT